MMRITINRSNTPIYEAMFDDLIQEVYGFSFAPWFARKLWDERYESYSIIQNGRILANVCIFKTDTRKTSTGCLTAARSPSLNRTETGCIWPM